MISIRNIKFWKYFVWYCMFFKGKNPESYAFKQKATQVSIHLYFFAIKRSNPQVLGVRHKTLRFRFHSHTFFSWAYRRLQDNCVFISKFNSFSKWIQFDWNCSSCNAFISWEILHLDVLHNISDDKISLLHRLTNPLL